ncbi:NAD-dependent epimerase/dehydratase family protein [Flavobacterium sp. RHBU_24]|uniref:NAD-dependent epimerase/dehydratase family protein n=1 Tax=Flavobacterium sp. RHBU_24 TaxID=3391185 RepID=UPI003984C385
MILVTGGTGLVGGHLLLRLAGTTPVRALYRNKANIDKTRKLFIRHGRQTAFESIEWVHGDIIDIPALEEAFAGVTYVYHCAANVSFDPADEIILRKTNIEGTANMVNCALAFGVEKFCHVSSIAALGDPLVSGGVITEETDWNPEVNHSDYQITKYGAEMEVWRAWQEGLNVVIVNPGLIFGGGYGDQGSGAVLKSVKKGQMFYTTGTCGIVAVEDVVEIMVRLMQSDINGARYTVIAENINYKDLLDTISVGMGKKGPSIEASKLMLAVGWRIDWLLSKLLHRKRQLTRHMAKSAYSTNPFDNSKIVNELDYKFKDMRPYLKELAAEYLTE